MSNVLQSRSPYSYEPQMGKTGSGGMAPPVVLPNIGMEGLTGVIRDAFNMSQPASTPAPPGSAGAIQPVSQPATTPISGASMTGGDGNWAIQGTPGGGLFGGAPETSTGTIQPVPPTPSPRNTPAPYGATPVSIANAPNDWWKNYYASMGR